MSGEAAVTTSSKNDPPMFHPAVGEETDALIEGVTTLTESVSVYSGMAGPGDPAALPAPAYLAALLLWSLIPLALAVLTFRRRAV